MIGIGNPNLITESTTLALGSYEVALPRTNARTRDYSQVARTTDDAHASSVIGIDHGSAKSKRALVIDGHNLSAAAQVRWGVGTTLGGSETTTTGLVDAWRFTPVVRSGRDHAVIIVLPQSVASRYDYIEIQDSSNPDGFVEFARVAMFDLFVPTFSPSYGLQDRLISQSGAGRSLGGSLWLNQQRTLREVSIVLEALSLTEGDTLHELQRAASLTEEVLYVPDLADAAAQQRYGFVGVLAELSAVEYPYYRRRKLPLRITQAA